MNSGSQTKLSLDFTDIEKRFYHWMAKAADNEHLGDDVTLKLKVFNRNC